MKKKFATLLLLAAVITTTTFATTIKSNVSQSVLTSFNKRFTQATDVNWIKADNYMKATFKMNGQTLFAYYSTNGELMGVARNIVTTQLPIILQTELTKELTTGWVSDLFEFSTDNETTYFITIESADAQVTLKGSGADSWTVFRKNRKS